MNGGLGRKSNRELRRQESFLEFSGTINVFLTSALCFLNHRFASFGIWLGQG
jgi:hypothetical protein